MRISDMDRKSKRDFLEASYDAATAAYENGELAGAHPSRQILAWSKLGSNAASDDVPPGGGEIDDEDIPGNATTPGGNRAGPRKTAVDSTTIALQELAIRRSGASDPEALIRAARLQREHDPAGVRANESMISGYSRLK